MKEVIERVSKSPKSTLRGLFTAFGSILAAGVAGAAAQFGQSPQASDWKPYAAAAAAAAVPALVGAFSNDPAPAPAISDTARQVAESIDQAAANYAAQKADEAIRRIREDVPGPLV